MAFDTAGNLLAAVSGDKPRLMRQNNGIFETIYAPTDTNDIKYIFDIALDSTGNIYLATGPNGKILNLGPAPNINTPPELIYKSKDNNILSLAVDTEGPCIQLKIP